MRHKTAIPGEASRALKRLFLRLGFLTVVGVSFWTVGYLQGTQEWKLTRALAWLSHMPENIESLRLRSRE